MASNKGEIRGKCGRPFKNQGALALHSKFCKICDGTMPVPGSTPVPAVESVVLVEQARTIVSPGPEPPQPRETPPGHEPPAVDLAPITAMLDKRFKELDQRLGASLKTALDHVDAQVKAVPAFVQAWLEKNVSPGAAATSTPSNGNSHASGGALGSIAQMNPAQALQMIDSSPFLSQLASGLVNRFLGGKIGGATSLNPLYLKGIKDGLGWGRTKSKAEAVLTAIEGMEKAQVIPEALRPPAAGTP